MEDYELVKSNVRGFLANHENLSKRREDIDIQMEKLDGLSNTNYLVTVTNTTTNERIIQIIYRKFGEISDVVDRDLETMIINYLADKGIGPKLLERDLVKKSFRIDEYLANTTPIPKSKQFDPLVLDQIVSITSSYNLICGVYKFNINGDKIKIQLFDEENVCPETKHYKIKQNMFDMCMEEMYSKAIHQWDIFSEEFRKNIPKVHNEQAYLEFEKFDYYMRHYHEIFPKVFPQNGFLILNHNDVHRLNLIVRKTDNKLFVLDHEYASLNLIGNDIANYMNESGFNYTPEYYFSPDEIDFDLYYQCYKKYIDEFIRLHPEMGNTEEGKNYFEKIQGKKYYINLHNVINLFWLLYCAIYLTFKDYQEGERFYYLHGIHRITYLEKGLEAMQKEK